MIQVWTPFTADRHVAAGGAALAAGIGGGLSSLGDAIGKMVDEKKKKGQLATVLRRKLSILAPDRKGDFDTMGLEDLQGEEEGQVAQSLQAKRAREMELHDAVLQQHQLRNQTIADAIANQAKEPAFMGRMSELMQPGLESLPTGQEGPANLVPGMDVGQALMQSGADTGFRPPLAVVLDDLIREGGGRIDWEKSKPREFATQSGRRGVYGKSGQFQFEDATPKVTDEGSIEVPDPSDPMYGPRIRIPIKEAREKYPHLLKGIHTPAGAPAAATGPATGQPPTITNQAEYDKLKSGETYIDASSGKTKRKK